VPFVSRRPRHGPHGDEYQTSTLYMETPGFDVYRRQGSYGRSKYRIRRYGGSEVVFLERKFRTERLLAKRRTTVALNEIAKLSEIVDDRCWAGQWFQRRLQLRRLHPIVQLSYDRVARVAASPCGPVRLTIDRHLRVLPLPDFAFLPPIGLAFLDRTRIIEMKYQGDVPALFRELAETFCLEAQKISKFRAAMRAVDYPLPLEPDEQVPHAPFTSRSDARSSSSRRVFPRQTIHRVRARPPGRYLGRTRRERIRTGADWGSSRQTCREGPPHDSSRSSSRTRPCRGRSHLARPAAA
jgi:hypothetical protein